MVWNMIVISVKSWKKRNRGIITDVTEFEIGVGVTSKKMLQ